MRRSLLMLVTLGTVYPMVGHALGLGEIRVLSALNQPLEAEVDVHGARPGEIEELIVSLADAGAFVQAGVQRTQIHGQLRFEVARRAGGQPYIKISSRDNVREPLLSFLVEADWARGRVVREFTILLDPPAMAMPRARPSAHASMPAAPARPLADPVPTGARAPEVRRAATAVRPTPGAGGPGEDGGRYGPVARNETLWEIAQRTRSDPAVSVQQMMVAYGQANPHAFIDGNINRLRRGVVLRIPNRHEIAAIEPHQAVTRVARHNSAWRKAGDQPREQLAKGVQEGTEQRSDGTDNEIVVTGAASSGAGSTVGDDTLQQTHTDANPEARRVLEVNQALKAQVALLERQVDQLQNLIDLKDRELRELQRVQRARRDVAERGASVNTTIPAPTDRASPSGEPVTGASGGGAKPAGRHRDIDAIGAAEGDTLLGQMLVPQTAVGIPLGILLASAVFYLRRRVFDRGAKADYNAVRDAYAFRGGSKNGGISDPASSEGGTETTATGDTTDITEPEDWSPDGQADSNPITIVTDGLDKTMAEVDIYLAYELHREAAELLWDVIAQNPDRKDYRVKLLETHFSAGDKTAFVAEAEALSAVISEGDGNHWSRVLAMGTELAPDHPMFREAPASDADRVHGGQQAELERQDTITLTVDDLDDLDDAKSGRGEEGAGTLESPEADRNDLQSTPASRQPPDEELERTETWIENDPLALDEDLDPESESAPEPTDHHAGADPFAPTGDDAGSDALGEDEAFEFPDLDDAQQVHPAPEETEEPDDDLPLPDDLDEIETKLDLARAFMDIGDAEGARQALDEVLDQGDQEQKVEAERLRRKI